MNESPTPRAPLLPVSHCPRHPKQNVDAPRRNSVSSVPIVPVLMPHPSASNPPQRHQAPVPAQRQLQNQVQLVQTTMPVQNKMPSQVNLAQATPVQRQVPSQVSPSRNPAPAYHHGCTQFAPGGCISPTIPARLPGNVQFPSPAPTVSTHARISQRISPPGQFPPSQQCLPLSSSSLNGGHAVF